MTIKQLSMLLIALLTSIHVEAQTLNVKAGNVTYRYPAELTGVMTYTNGDTLSILGKDYIIGNIDEATVADSLPSVNTVIVAYSDTAQSITVATEQWAGLETIDSRESNRSLFNSAISGLRLNFQMTGVTHVEVESVDGYAIAGTAMIHHGGDSTAFGIIDKQSIITYHAAEGSTMEPGTDYVVTIFPCDLYEGTGSPFSGTDLWHITSACISGPKRVPLSVRTIWTRANWILRIQQSRSPKTSVPG